jgi:hypothetical protein
MPRKTAIEQMLELRARARPKIERRFRVHFVSSSAPRYCQQVCCWHKERPIYASVPLPLCFSTASSIGSVLTVVA